MCMHIVYNTTKDVYLQHAGNLILHNTKTCFTFADFASTYNFTSKRSQQFQKMGVVGDIVHKTMAH